MGRRDRDEEPTPPLDLNGTVADVALTDANAESVAFLKDLTLQVEFGPYAEKGMSFQNFARTRRIAFQDEYEEIPEKVKVEGLMGQAKISDIRKQPEYASMREQFKNALKNLQMPETSKEFLSRFGRIAWRKIERSMRDPNPDIAREAVRAANNILEIEQPKASRQLPPQITFNMPSGMMGEIISALRQEGVHVPEPPRRLTAEVVDVEALPEPAQRPDE